MIDCHRVLLRAAAPFPAASRLVQTSPLNEPPPRARRPMSYQVQFPRLPADGAATTQPMVLLQNSAVPGVTFSITPEHYQSLLAAQQQQIQTQTQQNVQVQVVRPAPPAPPVPMSAVSASGSAADSPDEEQEPRQRGSKKTKIFNCPYCDRTFTRCVARCARGHSLTGLGSQEAQSALSRVDAQRRKVAQMRVL